MFGLTSKYLLVVFLGVLLFFSGARANDDVADDEDILIRTDGYTDEEWESQLEVEKETMGFTSSVTAVMDILINSLYSNREVFLRELISNSADALDKIRYKALTETDALGDGETANLEMLISFDKEANTITIRDRGVGMTKANLIKNLGTVAHSGTKHFGEEEGTDGDEVLEGDNNLALIGQFGVGFYSIYLVAEQVTVVSKNNDDDQYIWQSAAAGTFTIQKDVRGNTLGRGTEITMFLREDAEEFLNQHELTNIIKRYSKFVNYPIYLKTMKREDVFIPIEEERDLEDIELTDEDFAEAGLDASEYDDLEPQSKRETEEVWSFELMNEVKAIWTRPANEITPEEYEGFFHSLVEKELRDPSHYKPPLSHIHFQAAGEITFRSILFLPSVQDTNQDYHSKSTSLKLYVRRVLITDEFDDFLPSYLSFIKGVVDSDDLPLNVSRETLAQNSVLKVMSKKLTRKVLEMLRKLAEESEDYEDDEDDEDADLEDSDEVAEKGENKYIKFWETFGKSLKLGIIDDRANKSKLSKLLRYKSSKSDGEWISLEDYVDEMADDQKHIYYLTGQSYEVLENSPFLEQAKKNDYEVLFMIDALDEYVTQHLTEFDGAPLMSVAKEGLRIGNDDIDVAKYEAEFAEFNSFLKDTLDGEVVKVKISERLAESPCIIVTSQYGWTANMERIMVAQTFNNAENQGYMAAQKTLEINPRHPIIAELKRLWEVEGSSTEITDLVDIMYDAALVQSGFTFGNPEEFAARISRVIGAALDIDPQGEPVNAGFHDEL